MTLTLLLFLSCLSLAAWLYLAFGRSGFWRTDQRLAGEMTAPGDWPAVSILVPARNEADLLGRTLPSLLQQDYPGPFHVYLIDDRSGDNTAAVARKTAEEQGLAARLTVIAGNEPPAGWTGKQWALEQGVQMANRQAPPYFLFTDADIVHPANSLRLLVERAIGRRLDLVSLMVMLQARDRERLWLAAFVYFFAKLYPFRRVNDPRCRTAAAAGGVVLVRRQALATAGGLAPLAGALIDDCALAAHIKHGQQGRTGRIWLGLSPGHHSIRPYGGLRGVWQMVARTAYTQLSYSQLLLVSTILGMAVIYLLPPIAVFLGLGLMSSGAAVGWGIALTGFGGWLLMTATFLPLIRWYEAPVWEAALLPVAGLLYTLMTIDSARRHHLGRGGAWKGRFHGTPGTSP